MSRLAVVLVVLVVVLTAGCSGFADGDESPDREPYGVDEGVNGSVEDEPEALLTGLTTEGVTNASDLRETHQEAIGNRSYTIEYEYEYVIEEGTESFRRSSNSTIRVDPEAEVVGVIGQRRIEGNVSDVPATDEPNATVEQWFGERGVTRTELENGSVEYTPPLGIATTGSERIDTAERSLLSPLAGAVETTTVGAVDAEDGTYYVVNGSENVSGDGAEYGQDSREVDVRALVREDGLVRQTVAEQVMVMEDGERIRIAQTTEITAIGETEVQRPDWYEEAVTSGSGEPELENPPDEESDDNETPADDAEPDDAEGEE